MQIHEVSYLLRYLVAVLIVIFVWLQLRLSVKELRWDMKNLILPVKGYFLMFRKADGQFAGPEHEQVQALPLYHTTSIGRSSTCDIQIRRETISKRQAIIYLYDGIWFIRPAGRTQKVLINGVRIIPPTPLENQDQLTVGDQDFIFVNEKQSADDAGLLFRSTGPAPVFPKPLSAKKLRGSWLALNLLTLLCSLLLVFLTPASLPDLRLVLSIFCFGFLVFANIYYWLLPALLKSLDRVLILALLLLILIGIVFQVRLSLTAIIAAGKDLSSSALTAAVLSDLSTQGLSLFLGFALLPAILVLVARTRLLEPLSILCAVATPLLLLVTLFFGVGSESYGATLWINIGGTSIQLTEFAKITYLVVLASFFKNRPVRRNQLIFAGWAGMVFFLIMLLPDLGSAMILLPTTLLVFVVMTSEYWTTLLILFSGSGLGVMAFALFPHVQRRLSGWTSLWSEVNDSNRQIVYGLQAMARGGLFGRGIANGNPGGIPLVSSDMVFSIICEELGLISALGIVMVFIIIWLRSARITVVAKDGFTSSLALGIGTLFFFEAVIVIAGVTGLIPLTGATLPLIAKGGSSLLAKMILLSIQLGLSARRTEVS